MIRSTFGAPLGGTIRGGQYGLESLASSLITPPNGRGGAGSCFPSIVVVALGDPGSPVICWAVVEGATAITAAAIVALKITYLIGFIGGLAKLGAITGISFSRAWEDDFTSLG